MTRRVPLREVGPVRGPHGVGDGAGWGTVEGKRLRVLVLGDEARSDAAPAIRRALARRHEVVLSAGRGLFPALDAARWAHALRPHMVHALGLRGAATRGRLVAAGVGCPIVLSLEARDLELAARADRLSRSAQALIAAADAVLVEDGRDAEELRARRIHRELYVLAIPETHEQDSLFLGAIEVVYGRALARAGRELEGERAPSSAPEHLVQLGRGRAP